MSLGYFWVSLFIQTDFSSPCSCYNVLFFLGIPECLQNSFFEDDNQAKSTEIFLKLYSVPKYDSFHWKTSRESITNISTKYETNVTYIHFPSILYSNASFEVAVWKFSLIIYDLNQEDFDIYTLQVANKIGNISCSVRLQPTSKCLLK